MKHNQLFISAIAAATAICATFSACSGGNGAQMAPPAPEISVMVVEPTQSELEQSYPAIIKGKTDIAIRPQVTGFITKVHVDEGDHVRKGQVLFTLDQVQYQAAVDQAQAAVNSAKVSVDNAQINADNQRKLYDKNIISESQWITANNQLAQAKAALAQAQAMLESAKKNLSFTVVTSPADGIVGSIPNREGSLASPSSAQPLTTVSENSQMYAYFSLNEKDLLNLTNNGEYTLDNQLSKLPPVKLQLANGAIYPYEGKIATVSGVIDNTTGSATVRALFNNDNGMLRSGSTGQILIPEVTENAIVIPQKATFELQDKKFVYVINDSCIAVSTPVTILDINDGNNYVVTSGLNPGDKIAIEGVGTKVREGSKIVPKQADAAPQQN